MSKNKKYEDRKRKIKTQHHLVCITRQFECNAGF